MVYGGSSIKRQPLTINGNCYFFYNIKQTQKEEIDGRTDGQTHQTIHEEVINNSYVNKLSIRLMGNGLVFAIYLLIFFYLQVFAR